MDVELREALTQGFGTEPPHPPVADRLTAGHRAVRRRRVARAVVTVAAAAGLGLGSVAVLGDAGNAPTQVATNPGPTWGDGELARYSADGMVEVRPGATVLYRIDEPLGDPSDFNHSVALALEFQGARTWMILSWKADPHGGSSGMTAAGGPEEGTFADWVEQQVAANEDNSAGYVEFADDGSLVATHGVEIIDQRHPVELKDFTLGDEASAAALLQGPDGKKWYVLVRYAEKPDVIAVPFQTGGPDLDAFLEYARQKYASGEGLR